MTVGRPWQVTVGRPWQVTVGRPYAGAYGIARSCEEAREALTMARRLNLDGLVTRSEDPLIYRALICNQTAMADLVHTVLGAELLGWPERNLPVPD